MFDTEEGSKRLSHTLRRVSVIIIMLVVGLGMFHVSPATAEAPDEATIQEIQKRVEEFFTQKSQEALAFEERVQHIENYFSQWDLPAADYAEDFVRAADQYNIDWRLAPAIAMRETTGCRYTVENHATTRRKNNCFGWGNMSFGSIDEGIVYVTRNLAGENPNTAYYYADKNLRDKLYAYNSVIPDYYDDITRVMDDIYPQEEVFKLAMK